MQQETVIVLDFGGQYNQLIARRVRECNVYCEIYSYRTDLAKIKAKNPKGIIFTGGPNSAYLPDSPTIDPEIYNWGVPILGICYGSQLMMHMLGGKVCKAPEREYGKTLVDLNTASPLFDTLPAQNVCWMSHNDYIEQAAPGFEIVAHTPNCPVAAVQDKARGLYAVQFHPEVLHTENGTKILHNFVYNVCRCAGDWKMDSFVENSVKALREKIGDGKVLCALSGGVDSSVCAAMLAKAIGKQLTCVFVNYGPAAQERARRGGGSLHETVRRRKHLALVGKGHREVRCNGRRRGGHLPVRRLRHHDEGRRIPSFPAFPDS